MMRLAPRFWPRFAPLLLGLALAILPPASPALAVEPHEILADPVLEARARAISRQVRCPVCSGESIDDSSAQISRDLRQIIRERLVAGDSDAEVIDFLVARYGEVILFNPRLDGWNLLLWGGGPLMLLVAGGVVFLSLRRREAPVKRLTLEEEARLAELMKD
ncbi:cytochrome c-type biogenesis protein [Pseudogemmobacter sonorensis]|uniref:cytochrome c-type biogenesis protein n=1 Tax=Pseudogemmobacter sonorensis TaxID=2989681 RepID=UPI0036CF181D